MGVVWAGVRQPLTSANNSLVMYLNVSVLWSVLDKHKVYWRVSEASETLFRCTECKFVTCIHMDVRMLPLSVTQAPHYVKEEAELGHSYFLDRWHGRS